MLGITMHIFVDETGSFAGIEQPNSISLVGALVVPDERLASLEKNYAKLRRGLHKDAKGEVKGRLLNELDVARLIPVLFEHSVLFEAACIDLGLHTQAGLLAFRAQQAEKITNGLTDQHTATLKAQVQELRQRFEAFSLPLMVQTVLTFELLYRLIEFATMYFSTRRPQELGAFNWVIDAKGTLETPTEWEQWWSLAIMPFLQSRSFRVPFKHLPLGDYSSLSAFETEADSFIRAMGGFKDGDPPPLDVKKIMTESLHFSPESKLGLELVDILTNATRRALVGNLQKPGWVRIPEMMIHRKDRSYISIHALQDMPQQQLPYAKVLNAYGRGGRVMLPVRLQRNKF
jgi:hypothetical protein